MAVTRTGARGTLRRRGMLGAVLALVALAATGCTWEDVWRMGIPVGVTEQAQNIETVWYVATVAAMIVGAITYFLIIFAAIVYRKRSDDLPSQVQYHIPIEVAYTVLPFVIIVGLMYVTTVNQNAVLAEEPDPDVKVTVTGFKWNWEFEYDGVKAPNGKTVSTIGTSQTIPVLVLPTEETVQFTVAADDVIHSFWVPEFLFKRDAIPGRVSTFQVNITKEGSFVGHCAELCGVYHAYMNFEVRAVSPATYDRYVAARESGLSNPEALAAIGQSPTATTTQPLDFPKPNQSRS